MPAKRSTATRRPRGTTLQALCSLCHKEYPYDPHKPLPKCPCWERYADRRLLDDAIASLLSIGLRSGASLEAMTTKLRILLAHRGWRGPISL